MLVTNEIMRKNKQQKTVKTSTAGSVERSMLGKVYLWVSERKNSKYAQRPHRRYRRTRKLNISERYIRMAFKWSLTAPTACLRSIRDRISSLRNNKRNGK